ncbi:MAG: diaminopimelate epimerase [Phycisphaeraceae bacterium]|nr:diaminopimelate epimerase [Phycisphaeraceae bacterium]
MRFVKMHGIGNDYVYIDAYSTDAARSIAERTDLPQIARRISDRHRGVGSDGLILVCPPTDPSAAHVRMRMFNADGSESEMCGNGVRCVAKFAHDRLGIRIAPMRIETGRGVLSIEYETREGDLTSATVDMGEPILDAASVPFDESRLARPAGTSGAHIAERIFDAGQAGAWIGSCASMGNPHVVFFDAANPALRADGLARLRIDDVGPRIETHAAFPRRVNAHFVLVHSPREATMRTWERGAGATQACGTGACAVLVAGVRTGRLDRRALLHLPGGDLSIEWDISSNHVFMTGPAEEVFEGEWPMP